MLETKPLFTEYPFFVLTLSMHFRCSNALTRDNYLSILLGYFPSMSIFVFTVLLHPQFIALCAAFTFPCRNESCLEFSLSITLVVTSGGTFVTLLRTNTGFSIIMVRKQNRGIILRYYFMKIRTIVLLIQS